MIRSANPEAYLARAYTSFAVDIATYTATVIKAADDAEAVAAKTGTAGDLELAAYARAYALAAIEAAERAGDAAGSIAYAPGRDATDFAFYAAAAEATEAVMRGEDSNT